jgi:alpha-1,2-glucosyltransferase
MAKIENSWHIWIVTGFSVAVSAFIFTVINTVQSQPYMDEIFHIPQARKYCNGKFTEWDPKITTLPGLYVISVGILNPVSLFLERLYCDVTHLRLINVALHALSLPILLKITTQIHGNKHVRAMVYEMLNEAIENFIHKSSHITSSVFMPF